MRPSGHKHVKSSKAQGKFHIAMYLLIYLFSKRKEINAALLAQTDIKSELVFQMVIPRPLSPAVDVRPPDWKEDTHIYIYDILFVSFCINTGQY